MRPIQLRALPLVQTDLFDAAAPQAPQTSLQLHRNELVELLSQLMWQVASNNNQQLESNDEQDQP